MMKRTGDILKKVFGGLKKGVKAVISQKPRSGIQRLVDTYVCMTASKISIYFAGIPQKPLVIRTNRA